MNRAADVALAGLGLALTSPLLAAATLVIKLEDGGPVLFRQPRVGKDGTEFELVKLCTGKTAHQTSAVRRAINFVVVHNDRHAIFRHHDVDFDRVSDVPVDPCAKAKKMGEPVVPFFTFCTSTWST